MRWCPRSRKKFKFCAAQYESWSLPLAVILIVPMCLLSAMTGVLIRGQDNNIFTQIGMKFFGRMPKKKQSSIEHRERRENLVH
jgi:AcrB/AcrD/AcrF family